MSTELNDLSAPALRPHPQRQMLNDEAHARPSLAMVTPSRISSLTFWFEHGDSGQREALVRLTERLGLATPEEHCVQYQADSPNLHISWSLHTEFSRYGFSTSGKVDEPFDDTALSLVPADWLASVPGRLLAGMHAALIPADQTQGFKDFAAHWFKQNELIGAFIADGDALALTDLRLHPDSQWNLGFTRLLMIDHGMRSRTGGRMLTRLFEIESYRMLALLALPLAKQQMRKLDTLDSAMKHLTSQINEADNQDSVLLNQLNTLAAELEDQRSHSQYRFSAAHAYYRLIEQRIIELRELRQTGLQPFNEFVHRRLAPAIETCATVERRHADLADRIQRSSSLLRTRVEIEQQQQTQLLLASMNRRAALQLRLQKTVEGLSVGVLTYYVVSLISYGAKALKELGLALNPDLCAGLSIPLVGILVWSTVHHVKKRF